MGVRIRRGWRRLADEVGKAALVGCLVIVLVAGAVLSFVASAWFWSEVQDYAGDKVETLPAAPAVSLPEGRRVYVALGDSYSSGEGVEPYEPRSGDPADAGDRCHRSTDAYSQQIQFTTAVEIRFRACSGARIPDMYAEQKTSGGGNHYGAQLSPGALSSRVGLVTMTIGGNDLGFSDVMSHCFSNIGCMEDEFDDSFDDGKRSGLSLESWAHRRMATLEGELRRLLQQIRHAAPEARVIVIGYPNLLWSRLPDSVSKDCLVEFALIESGEANALLNFQKEFDALVDRLAAETGVEFVRTSPVFMGHEPCANDTRWLDFIVPAGEGEEGPLDPGTLHPNRNGHYIISRVISCYLSDNPEYTNSYDEDFVSSCARGR